MRHCTLICALVVLGGCQPDSRDSPANIDELSNRIEAVEHELDELSNHLDGSIAKAVPQRLVAPAPMEEGYQLVGRGAMDSAGTKYPSKERCEAAKQVLIEDAAERAEQARRQGAVYSSIAAVSCIPL